MIKRNRGGILRQMQAMESGISSSAKHFWNLSCPLLLVLPSPGRETQFCLLRISSASLKRGRESRVGMVRGERG